MMEALAVLLPPVLIALTVICVQEAWRMRHSLQGYKQVTIRGASNMTDEYDRKYTKPASSHDTSRWQIKALYIHPIKSCGGVELDVADVDAAGLTWDRKFAFAELLTPQTRGDAPEEEKKPRWTFRTLRQPGFEKLALVKPEIWIPETASKKTQGKDQGFMIVKYPRIPRGPLAAIIKFVVELGFISNERSFCVPLVPDDFRAYLEVRNQLTLFRVDPKNYREVHRCAPRKEQLGYQSVVGFADAYPVHLLNIASVRDVAGKVGKDIPRLSARRFRSNVLMSGPVAYNEDDWKKIKIGNHLFYCACHTVRCRLPNVDPDTAERHQVEPDRTLKSFRCIDDGDPLNACLGLQLVPAESTTFQIRVGDEVEVLERGEHHYIKQ